MWRRLFRCTWRSAFVCLSSPAPWMLKLACPEPRHEQTDIGESLQRDTSLFVSLLPTCYRTETRAHWRHGDGENVLLFRNIYYEDNDKRKERDKLKWVFLSISIATTFLRYEIIYRWKNDENCIKKKQVKDVLCSDYCIVLVWCQNNTKKNGYNIMTVHNTS